MKFRLGLLACVLLAAVTARAENAVLPLESRVPGGVASYSPSSTSDPPTASPVR